MLLESMRNSFSMGLLMDNWFSSILSLFIALLVIFISWMHWSHYYWKRKGLITPPTSLLGSISLTQQESPPDFSKRIYQYFRDHNQPHGGVYVLHIPSYVVVDPEFIKSIMQTDFDHFVDRGVYFNEETDPLSAHLFSLEGTKWKNLRRKLTPTFTSGKMKMMLETLIKCSDELVVEMDRTIESGLIDIKNILMRFTTDIICTCALGIECNSLKNPNNEFSQYQKLFFTDTPWENFIKHCSFIAPSLCKKFGVRIVNQNLAKFFMRIMTETVEYREKNNIHRKDFLDLLIQLKNQGKLIDDENLQQQEQISLTFNELAAQAFVFFLAGFETSSTTMTFCLFELASNTEIQKKVRQEISDVLKRHDNQLTYDALMEMHYMEKVLNETLRKYPPLSNLTRICCKEYKVPGTDVTIEKGTIVLIPAFGLHRDENYYPDPEKFDPERFSDENKNNRHPFTFLPFGEGPRICIGLRFGMMQMKVGLSVLLKNYKFLVNSKTTVPLKFDRKSFTTNTEGGIWLNYHKV